MSFVWGKLCLQLGGILSRNVQWDVGRVTRVEEGAIEIIWGHNINQDTGQTRSYCHPRCGHLGV